MLTVNDAGVNAVALANICVQQVVHFNCALVQLRWMMMRLVLDDKWGLKSF